jgi:hypothetical protein
VRPRPECGHLAQVAALERRQALERPHLGEFEETLRVGFRLTSPRHAVERGGRSVPDAGPCLVITDLGVYDIETPTREMRLASIHPGVTLEKVRENLGVLRGLDPRGLYLSGGCHPVTTWSPSDVWMARGAPTTTLAHCA